MTASEKSVLVTGATGFIGRSLTRALASRGWNVTTLSRGNCPENINNHCRIDLDDCFALQDLNKTGPYGAIVHLAARIGLEESNDRDMMIPNVVSTGILANYAREWNADYIFASTALVHGSKSKYISKNTPIMPDIPYAKTKWIAEEIIRSLLPTHTILRMGGVFGYEGPSHLGINRAIRSAMGGGNLQISGSGKALRNYIYVEDVARIICDILGKRITGTYLLGGSQILSIQEMLEIIANRFLPGYVPEKVGSEETSDQIVECSYGHAETRSFIDAVDDIFKLMPSSNK